MKKLDTSLLCFEIGSTAHGYRVLKTITDVADTGGLRVLDASPVGAKFMILALGETSALQEAAQKSRAALDAINPALTVDLEVIDQVSQQVVDAIFNLPQVELQDALVVVESATVSGCLSAAQAMVAEHGLSVIEIRIQRSSTGGAVALVTGPSAKCAIAAEEVRTLLRERLRKSTVEIVDKPGKSFRAFFNLGGGSGG